MSGDEFLSHAGSGSGGYLHHVFSYAAKHLFGEDVKELTYKILKWVCVASFQKLDLFRLVMFLENLFQFLLLSLKIPEQLSSNYLCHRNKDFQEVTLEKDGQVLLCFASTYGFRNIQNLVQKLKRGKSSYHFVEVMACPSGKVKYLDVQNVLKSASLICLGKKV